MEELPQQPTVELTFLLKHESCGISRIPRLLVRSCGRQCIVDVANRGNADGDANLFVEKAVGIAAAIDPFVMVKADVKDNPRHVALLGQKLVAM